MLFSNFFPTLPPLEILAPDQQATLNKLRRQPSINFLQRKVLWKKLISNVVAHGTCAENTFLRRLFY